MDDEACLLLQSLLLPSCLRDRTSCPSGFLGLPMPQPEWCNNLSMFLYFESEIVSVLLAAHVTGHGTTFGSCVPVLLEVSKWQSRETLPDVLLPGRASIFQQLNSLRHVIRPA